AAGDARALGRLAGARPGLQPQPDRRAGGLQLRLAAARLAALRIAAEGALAARTADLRRPPHGPTRRPARPHLRHRSRRPADRQVMRAGGGDWLERDPAYSPNLTAEREDFSYAWPPRVSPR